MGPYFLPFKFILDESDVSWIWEQLYGRSEIIDELAKVLTRGSAVQLQVKSAPDQAEAIEVEITGTAGGEHEPADPSSGD